MEKYRVIIADDQRMIRNGLSMMIDWGALGFEVVGLAQNGQEALALIAEKGCDLLISDIRMPAMDGLELARQARGAYPDLEIVMVSGYSEFQYAQTAMKYGVHAYLLKPISEEKLTEAVMDTRDRLITLKDQKARICEGILLNMVHGSLRGRLLAESFEKLGMGHVYGHYCVAVLFIGALIPNYEAIHGHDEFIGRIAQSAMALMGGRIACHAAASDPQKLVLLFALDEPDLRRVYAALLNLIRELGAYAQSDMKAAVGPMVSRLEDIRASYREAAGIMGETHFFFAEDLIVVARAPVGAERRPALVDGDDVVRAVRDMREDLIEREVDGFLGRLFEAGATPAAIHLSATRMLARLFQLPSDTDDVLMESIGSVYYDALAGQLTTASALRGHLVDICRRVCEQLELSEKRRGKIIIQDIIRYVDTHYAERLTIKHLSEIFYTNPAYLGRLFTRKTGQTYNAYLNRVRIEQAMLLLRQTNRKVHDICISIGYGSLKYFHEMFKETTGMTPVEYRMSRHAGAEED